MERVIAALAQEEGCDATALRAEAESLAATHGMGGSLETVAASLATSCGCTSAELVADAERIAGLARADAA